MPKDTADRLAIRELIENWALWRDARLWDRFRTVWHKDGQMWATWFQGTYEDFIQGQPGRLRPRRAHHAHARRHERSTSRASARSRRPR